MHMAVQVAPEEGATVGAEGDSVGAGTHLFKQLFTMRDIPNLPPILGSDRQELPGWVESNAPRRTRG